MRYYGIVEKIKKDHKAGVYGRRKYNEQEIKELQKNKSTEQFNLILSTLTTISYVISPITYLTSFFTKAPSKELTLQHEDSNGKWLIFDNDLMENDYSIANNTDLFYGLFDKYLSKDKMLESLLKSKGGSMLIIIAREDIPSYMHFGGSAGKFNLGLYTSHPKHDDILIPLEGSADLIKNMILEETLRAYEALGAKRIEIKDLTEIKSTSNTGYKNVTVSANADLKNNSLREKIFGKGVFDPNRALKNSVFIHDLPNVVTTLEGRIHGNQLLEKFVETVNLSVGLDVAVLNEFSSKTTFNYNREWSFEVEFYDKNELEQKSFTEENLLPDSKKINLLLDKIINIFKSKTLSQIELGLGTITESEFSVLSGIPQEDKKAVINDLIERSNMDGSISFKELEYVLNTADKFKLDLGEIIDELNSNYNAVLYFLKDSAKETEGSIVQIFPGQKVKAIFYPDSRICIYNSDDELLEKGSYAQGGRKIELDNGKSASSISVQKNILSVIS
jgi:hypothetical protein